MRHTLASIAFILTTTIGAAQTHDVYAVRYAWASQYVSVTAKPGIVVLASDNMYRYENLDKHVPIAQTFDAVSNLAAQDRMKTLVKDPRFIIPGHDPAVLTRFPTIADGVVHIE